jgi:hypothetical protein
MVVLKVSWCGIVHRRLSRKGFFPLENVVHIDPDHFRSVMPEWPGYVAVDKADRAGGGTGGAAPPALVPGCGLPAPSCSTATRGFG